MSDDRLGIAAAAAEAGVSVDMIRRHVRSGALRAYRPGGGRRIVILREDLLEWAFGEDRAVAPIPPRAQLRVAGDEAEVATPRRAAADRSRRPAKAGSVERLLEIERRA